LSRCWAGWTPREISTTIEGVTSCSDELAGADLQQIIAWVYADWDGINPSAAAYLHALDVNDCRQVDDPVGNETADTQLRHFLTHAAAWRGPKARAIKAEVRHRLGLKI
jgi:hypothetical protein